MSSFELIESTTALRDNRHIPTIKMVFKGTTQQPLYNVTFLTSLLIGPVPSFGVPEKTLHHQPNPNYDGNYVSLEKYLQFLETAEFLPVVFAWGRFTRALETRALKTQCCAPVSMRCAKHDRSSTARHAPHSPAQRVKFPRSTKSITVLDSAEINAVRRSSKSRIRNLK